MNRNLGVTLLAFAGLLAVVPAAWAWPFLDVTASEVVSVDPPRWRTTFTIYESGPTMPPPPYGCGWAAFDVSPLHPGTPEAPQFFACTATLPWQCSVQEYLGVAKLSFFPNGGGDIHHDNSFSIVTDRAEPCVRVEYWCVILLGSPAAPAEGCLSPDMPVPAYASSWGAVKVIYR